MQFAYDSLIKLANSAYLNSMDSDLVEAGLDHCWLAKAESYEWGAHMMNSALMVSGIYINSKQTDREKDKEQKVVGKNRWHDN